MQARLSAAFEGAPLSSAAGGAAAAALAASLSAFSAASATRTSLVAAPRSGCCACSLASSGLKPRSGSATRSPRTASRRASGVQGSPMRGAPGARAAAAHWQPPPHRPPGCRTASPSLREGADQGATRIRFPRAAPTSNPTQHLHFVDRRPRCSGARLASERHGPPLTLHGCRGGGGGHLAA
eukprot:scaffold64370_cov55-Phaeocystis_antarctica.AAC.3